MEMQESQELQELHRNIIKYSIQHIQRVSSPAVATRHIVIMTAVERKTVAVDADNCISGFSSFFPPKFEKAKFSTNTGITPKSNENSEFKKEKRSKTTELDRTATIFRSTAGRVWRMHHTNFNSLYT